MWYKHTPYRNKSIMSWNTTDCLVFKIQHAKQNSEINSYIIGVWLDTFFENLRYKTNNIWEEKFQ